jgi:DNA-binding IclR family transcriptional regulator
LNQLVIDEQPSQTLARGLQILEKFSSQRSEWGVRELGRELDLNPATVHRLVTTLANLGYLEQDQETQRYALGPKVMRLAELYTLHNPISSIARKIFQRHAQTFPYNFYLGKLSGFEVVYLTTYEGRAPIKVVVEPGATIALHSTAVGLSLLACQEESFIESFLEKGALTRYTDATVTDPRRLRVRLDGIRQKQYAINRGEHYADVGAVGAPVVKRGKRVEYGVSLAYPQHLVAEGRVEIPELIALTQEMAAEIAARMA